MQAHDVIRNTIQNCEELLQAYLGDLTDRELVTRPNPQSHHIAWQLIGISFCGRPGIARPRRESNRSHHKREGIPGPSGCQVPKSPRARMPAGR